MKEALRAQMEVQSKLHLQVEVSLPSNFWMILKFVSFCCILYFCAK